MDFSLKKPEHNIATCLNYTEHTNSTQSASCALWKNVVCWRHGLFVLNDLLKGQQALQTKTADLEKQFIELESKQASASLSSSGSEKERGKRNRIVTSELSVSLCSSSFNSIASLCPSEKDIFWHASPCSCRPKSAHCILVLKRSMTLQQGMCVGYVHNYFVVYFLWHACRLMSPTNQEVLSKIVSEIIKQPGCKYEEKIIKGTIPTW